jgi:hypothetical protein
MFYFILYMVRYYIVPNAIVYPNQMPNLHNK